MARAGLIVEEELRIIDREGVPTAWPVAWSAVWVGALGAVALALVIGLIGIAIGAHRMTPYRIASWHEFGLPTLAFSVFGSFLAFAAGGWVAARIGGLRRTEDAMLHGAIVWVLSVPLLLVIAALGGAAYFGEWYAGLAGTPAWVTMPPLDADAARAARNGALGALTALLLGLMGGVIGGWLGSRAPSGRTSPRHA